MNKTTTLLCCVTMFFSLGCFNNKEEQEKALLHAKIDSLERENVLTKNNLQDMTEYIDILANGLDSIAYQEEMLITNKGPEGTSISRDQLKQNLGKFEEILNEQKLKITQLADSLKVRGTRMERMSILVDYLQKQIEEKDLLIKQLRRDIDNNRINIKQLTKQINSLNEDNQKLTQEVEIQKDILTTQDAMINECYIKIGSKKSLMEEGIVSGGFLKKSKVNVDKIDKNRMQKVDIRTFKELVINATSPKVLTQMPSGSYRIVKMGDGSSILQILDANLFWSMSNFLIIQTK